MGDQPTCSGPSWLELVCAPAFRGNDLVLYQIRLKNGAIDPYSTGKLVSNSGAATDVSDFVLIPTEYWTSPRDHARYPIGWHLLIPKSQIDLEITTPVPEQELSLAVTYWEGAIRANGVRAGNPVHGVGYLELTGYGATIPALGNGLADHAKSG